MKTFAISLCSFFLIIGQGCIVYQKSSVSLDQAIDKGHVRVVTNDGRQLDFKKIILKDEILYGIPNDTELVRLQLNPKTLESIFLQNKAKSIVLSSLLLAPNVVLLTFAIMSASDVF